MQKYIARQPILDARERTFGFELLFRSGPENYFHAADPDRASATVMIDSFLLFGMQTLTAGRHAFINFTRKLLVERCPAFLPNDQLIIEILENIEPDTEVIEACQALRKMGYRFALDDFVYSPEYRPLLDLADFIKVDFRSTPTAELERLAKAFGNNGVSLVAEKVETREEFNAASGMGYRYFQGYFFSKPQVVSRRDIPTFKVNYIRMLSVLLKPEPDLRSVEEIIKGEPSLCLKLLRYLNSTLFGFATEIRSIRHALSLLGLNELRRWISLATLAGLSENKPPVLVMNSLVRAKQCELLTRPAGMVDKSMDLFLVGLFSLIDSILDQPMVEVLERVSISGEVRETLLGRKSSRMRGLLELVIAWEEGDWEGITRQASCLKLDEPMLAEAHFQAVQWGNQVFDVGSPPGSH